MEIEFTNLHLFEVTHCLNGQFAFDGGRGIARFKLDDALGSLVQASHISLQLI